MGAATNTPFYPKSRTRGFIDQSPNMNDVKDRGGLNLGRWISVQKDLTTSKKKKPITRLWRWDRLA